MSYLPSRTTELHLRGHQSCVRTLGHGWKDLTGVTETRVKVSLYELTHAQTSLTGVRVMWTGKKREKKDVQSITKVMSLYLANYCISVQLTVGYLWKY